MDDFSEISEDYSAVSEDYPDDEAEGTTANEEGATPEDEGTSVNYTTAAWDGAPVMVRSGDVVSSELLGKYNGEEYSHRVTDGLVNAEGYDRTLTEYMSAEDRQAFRLTAKDGKLYDSSGALHSSDPHAKGDYPGSTGGDIFVLDQGGLFAINQRAHQDYINADPDAGDESGAAFGVMEQSYTDEQGDGPVNYTGEQPQEGLELEADGEGESVYRTVHHSTLAAGQRAPGDRTPLRVAAAGEIQTEQGEVRSISDASGHFHPTTAQTAQMVGTLEAAGVDLSNTSINLVAKPGYDAAGAVPAVDVYNGEFKAAKGDQRALTRKRGAMEELRARFAAGDLPAPGGLEDAEYAAEKRSQGIYNELDEAGVYEDAEGGPAPEPSLDDLRAAAADVDVSQIPGAPVPGLDDLRAMAADVDVSQIPGGAGWQGASPQSGRSGTTLGGQRGQAWQSARPRGSGTGQ
jgi:hypothetical protein